MNKEFFIGVFVFTLTIVSVLGVVMLGLMIGFDEGRNYQAYKDSRVVASCNETIAGWSK